LPVFAGGLSAWSPSSIPGMPVIAGPTAGYLVGFVIAAAVVGALAERGCDRRFATTLAAMLVGNVVIYVFGLAWLARFVGVDHVVALGLAPFLVGDAVKLVLATFALPSAWRLLGR
jgi:biotin transport system substrate-specific component